MCRVIPKWQKSKEKYKEEDKSPKPKPCSLGYELPKRNHDIDDQSSKRKKESERIHASIFYQGTFRDKGSHAECSSILFSDEIISEKKEDPKDNNGIDKGEKQNINPDFFGFISPKLPQKE